MRVARLPWAAVHTCLVVLAAGCGGSGTADPGGSGNDPPPGPSGSDFDPGFNPSTNRIEVFYDGGLTSQQNGDALETVLESLEAGDRVVIHTGTYTISNRLGVSAPGTEANPITIEAAAGEQVVITRGDANQNTVDLDSASYLTLRGIEIVGGSIGLRIGSAHHVFVHRCEVHDPDDAAITANSSDTSHLYFVDNHIHHTNGHAEGFYLGANDAVVITHHTYVLGNHVHDTGGIQGDGVEIKTGSYACVIADNLIENTHYPGVLVYGNGGRPERNVIERNVIIASTEGGIQVAADAIVRNNLIIGAGDACIVSQVHQDASPSNLTIVHNTLVNDGVCLHASSWTGPNIVFANNALYTTGSPYQGSTGTALLVANITLASLDAFESLSLDGVSRDATPSAGSPLIDMGDATYAVPDDLTGAPRVGSLESGAVDLQ